jgi:hypothetical protein
MSNPLRSGLDWAGLAAGPAAWAASTQGHYAAAAWTCERFAGLLPVSALVLAAVALAGAALSWRAWRVAGAPVAVLSEQDGRPSAFLAATSALTGLLFAAVIVMQGAAGLILAGCER